MDQNGNFIPGEMPDDMYAVQFNIAGPRVTSATPNSTAAGQDYRLRLVFNESIDVTSFRADKVLSLTGPNGAVSVLGVAPVPNMNFTQFDVLFAPQTTAGAYTLTLSQHIKDVYGNEMDQNNNQVPGQDPYDQYTGTFTVSGPQIVATSPAAGTAVPAANHVRVTFNTPINAGPFTPAQITSFTGPTGPIAVTGVTEVSFTNHTQFDITFATQFSPGAYTMTIGPNIQDVYGNLMDSAYTATFRIPFTYTAAATPFQDLEIVGQPGTFTIISAADDESDPVNLGADSFTFYGTTYTGNNQLFVSSNGLISFGVADSAFTNTNLAGSPAEPVIAPLWDDWITGPGSPMVVGRFENLAGGGRRLVIEWNKVNHYPGRMATSFTFQAILSLDTGSTPGDIVFNYRDTNPSDPNYGNGRNATVGVKDAGTSNPSRTLVSFRSLNPLVGSGKAILVSPAPAGSGTPPSDVNPTPVGAGPRVTSPPPNPTVAGQLYSLRVAFNEPIDVSSFTPSQIASFAGPGGSTPSVVAVAPVTGTNYTQFDVLFAPLTGAGSYTMVIGPHIRDVFGREMDQDNNNIPGETPQDQYTATFTVAAPQVVSSSPAGSTPGSIDHVRLTFNSPIDTSTFTPGKVSFTGPGGTITVSGVPEVPYTNHTQFDVTFAPQTALGSYSLVVGPNILDVYGNSVPQFTYNFTRTNNAVLNGDFETGSFSPAWTTGGGAPTPVISTAQAHGGTYSAFLGTLNNAGSEPSGNSFIRQTIVVPAGHPTLSFWYYPNTTDSVTFDWQEAQIQSTGGATLAQIFKVASNAQTWTHVTYDLTPWAGQTVVLYFNVHQDGFGDPTGMYLDDVVVS
jgi:methionine-rich copper-binding protein CopC